MATDRATGHLVKPIELLPRPRLAWLTCACAVRHASNEMSASKKEDCDIEGRRSEEERECALARSFASSPVFVRRSNQKRVLPIPFLSYEEQKKVPKFFMDIRVSEGSYF